MLKYHLEIMMGEAFYNPPKPTVNLSGVRLSTSMHPAGFPPLTGDVLESIVQRVVTHQPVEKIILFGSYTGLSGSPTPDSDIDLLIIMETSESLTRRVLSISRLLRPRPFPMDILVRTPQEITDLLESGDSFFQEIIGQGRVIYDRQK
jgi:predicted nucleotidyltransferase